MTNIIKMAADRLAGSVIARKLRGKIRIDPSEEDDYRFKIAQDRREFEAACRLVHDRYVRKGYMTPQRSRLRLSLWHALPESTTFIGKKNDLVVNTLTLFQDSDLGLPMDAAYKRELDRLRKMGRKIAEVGALATHPFIQRGNQTVLMCGNKIVHTYSRNHLRVDDLVIAVNPRHEWFYERILLFEKIGGLTNYDYVKRAPAVAYRLDLHSAAERCRAVYGDSPPERNLYRFFFVDESPSIALPLANERLCFWDSQKIRYFFQEKTDLLIDADTQTRRWLERECDYFNSKGEETSSIEPFPAQIETICPVVGADHCLQDAKAMPGF